MQQNRRQLLSARVASAWATAAGLHAEGAATWQATRSILPEIVYSTKSPFPVHYAAEQLKRYLSGFWEVRHKFRRTRPPGLCSRS
jgi:hypothetical protein